MASPGPPHTAGEGSQETLRPGDLKPETLLPGTLNPAQLEGLKEVLSFRQWWKDYDRMTKGTGDTGGGLEDNPEVSLLPSLEPGVFLDPSVYLVAWLVLMAAALVALVWLMCSRSSRRSRSNRSSRGSGRTRERRESLLSLPPPYAVVVEEKARMAAQEGLPSYREACPTDGYIEACPTDDYREACPTDSYIEACPTDSYIEACPTDSYSEACPTDVCSEACPSPQPLQSSELAH